MPQTPQNKTGILAPFGLKPIFRSMFHNGGIGGSPLGYGPILHVSKTGSDSNKGSILSPFLTINKAMRLIPVCIHYGIFKLLPELQDQLPLQSTTLIQSKVL